jgi:predicted phage terminase large subunit-like protein
LLPEQERRQAIQSLSQKEAEVLLHDWHFWARPNQLPPPGDWLVWLIMAGRGFGKTRAAGEFVIAEVKDGRAGRVALVAKTPADARDIMVEGESGILNISPPWFKPEYESSKRRLTWPNGAIATVYSSKEPDHLNGPQHDLAWGDEVRTWYSAQEVWDMLMFGLRLGEHPRCVATTTPLPIQLIRDLIKMPDVVVTRGTTYENRMNLAPSFFSQIIRKYEGTRLGQQEIKAELLEDVPGALWNRGIIQYKSAPDLVRVVVAIDPATTSKDSSDETGIVVAGKAADGLAYVLSDRSARVSPDAWARRSIQAFDDYRADKVIGEVNNGGDLVELTIRTVRRNVPYKAVHASRGKYVRAEPVAALYEQGKVFHVQPFTELEDQMCTWLPESGESPDRMDALVWALTELMLQEPEPQEEVVVYDSMQLVRSMDL